MNRDDILAFARRDWAQIADAKTEFWREQKRGLTVAEVLAIGDQLRRHVRAVRPDWPSPSERAEDLAVHHRVAEALRAVDIRPR